MKDSAIIKVQSQIIRKIFSILSDVIAEQATCERSGNDWGTEKLNEVNELREQLDRG